MARPGRPLRIADRGGRTGWLYGGYVQDEWRIDRDADAEPRRALGPDGGIRHRRATSPRVNLVWRPTGTTTLHAGYARTFTPPQFELVQNADPCRVPEHHQRRPQPEQRPARPERAHRFDVGASQQLFGGNLTLGVDAYYKHVRDLLDFGQFGNALIFTPFNYGRA